MNIKKMLKLFLSPVQKIRYRIKNSNGFLYIGKGCKIVGANNMKFGENVSIMPYTMLVAHGEKSRIKFGKGTEIGMYSRIAAQHDVTFGNYVLTGPHIFIADYNHEFSDITQPVMHQGNCIKSTDSFPDGGVHVGDGTWIGTNCVIAGTIVIGKNCVIGANSVVTHDIPDYCVAVGSPAKVIKKFNTESNYWEKVI